MLLVTARNKGKRTTMNTCSKCILTNWTMARQMFEMTQDHLILTSSPSWLRPVCFLQLRVKNFYGYIYVSWRFDERILKSHSEVKLPFIRARGTQRRHLIPPLTNGTDNGWIPWMFFLDATYCQLPNLHTRKLHRLVTVTVSLPMVVRWSRSRSLKVRDQALCRRTHFDKATQIAIETLMIGREKMKTLCALGYCKTEILQSTTQTLSYLAGGKIKIK